MRHFVREDDTLYPDVSNLKTYGYTAYVYDNSILRSDKFAIRVLQGVVILTLHVARLGAPRYYC
jgi:hypothetical protein